MPVKFNPLSGQFDLVNPAPDLSGYVPYTGATGSVDLNGQELNNFSNGYNTGSFTFLNGGVVVDHNGSYAEGALESTKGGFNNAIYTTDGTNTVGLSNGSQAINAVGDITTTNNVTANNVTATYLGSFGATHTAILGDDGIKAAGFTDGTNTVEICDNTNALTATGSITATNFNGVALTAAGGGTNFLADDGTYQPVSVSGYVPYTGATTNVSLGTYGLTSGKLNVTNASAAQVAATITAASGQTANLFEIHNVDRRLYADKDGVLNLRPATESAAVNTATNYAVNGDPFVSGLTSWTFSSGWSYSAVDGGSALHASGNVNTLTQVISAPLGAYQVNYTLGTGTSSSFRCEVNGVDVITSATAGAKSAYFVNTTGTITIILKPGTTQTRPVSGFRVYAVSASTALLYGKSTFGSTTFEMRGDTNGNIAIGLNAMKSNISGNYTVAIGKNCLTSNVTAGYNIAIGEAVMQYSNTSFNCGIGYYSLAALTTGAQNFGLGYQTLPVLTTGNNNTATGILCGSALTTGTGNDFYGNNAGRYMIAGSYNAFYGQQSGGNISAGSGNTFLGGSSGSNHSNSSYCLAVGYGAALYENVTEDYRGAFGQFMFGRYANDRATAAVGFGCNASSTARVTQQAGRSLLAGTATAQEGASQNIVSTGSAYLTDLAVGDKVVVRNNYSYSDYYLTVSAIATNLAMTLSGSCGSGDGYSAYFSVTIWKVANILSGKDEQGTEVCKLESTGRAVVNRLNISNIPTSSAGLVAGDVWSNAGILTIV